MFGYVRPLRGALDETAFGRYQAAYCGLCARLGERHGFAARFTVNYDLTFLSLLFDALQPERETILCRCPAHPTRKKSCLPGGPEQAFCADLCVILYYHKLRDTVADETFFRSLGARLCARLLRRAYRRAARDCPEEDALVRDRLRALTQLEHQRCASIDRTADAFASILRACAMRAESGAVQRVLSELLYHVGRYIYLTDALDDLPRDCQSGVYNVLAERYGVEDGKLSEENRTALCATIDASIGLAAAAFELLPIRSDRAILENIIYQGLPAVLTSVAEGTFHTKKKNRSVT